MKEDFYIGQIFDETYPPEAAVWCNENNAMIQELEPENGVRRFEIVEIPEHIPTKEDIRAMRQVRYTNEADPIRYEYDEALARGEETAEEKKQAWLDKKDEIRAELPYPEEE